MSQENLTINTTFLEVHAPSHVEGNKEGKSPLKGNALAVLYYYIMETVRTTCEGANAQAKQIKANATGQENLNHELNALNRVSIPKVKHKYVEKKEPDNFFKDLIDLWGGYHTVKDLKSMGKDIADVWGGYTPHKKVKKPDMSNKVKIEQANTQDERISGERSQIAQKAKNLGQTASSLEDQLNANAQEMTETMQVGAKLLQMISSLTFKVLMRSPIQAF